MCTPVERDSASYSFRSRPWNMPVLSTIVCPPCSRKSASFAGQDLEDLRPVHGDVRGVLGARDHRQQRLVDRNHTQFRSRDGTQDRIDGLSGRGVERVTGGDGWGVTHLASPLKIGY